jgi:hypothetical protein
VNPELQTVVDRLELVERQSRGWKLTALVALLAACASLVLQLQRSRVPGLGADHARYSVVEANRFLLRDLDGSVAGGLESSSDGSLRLVLGNRRTASAHLVVAREGNVQLTLRAPDGGVRAGIAGSDQPSVWIAPTGGEATAALRTRDDGGGEVLVRDARGQGRFRAP